MFSVVPFNLNLGKANTSNHVTVGDVTGSIKLLVPGRAIAATNIPQGAMTIPIDPQLLRGQCDIVQILVGTNPFGTIELHDSSNQIWCKNIHWIRALRLSDDCHSCNIQLKLQPSVNKKKVAGSKLILQAVRPIPVGQELLLWFSEDILATMQMVFLTPANIQGQKKYVCTRCSALYESPNPLKLHIMLKCSRQSILDLWDKLANLLMQSSRNNSTEYLPSTEFTFQLTPELSLSKQKTAMDLSISNSSVNIKRPISHPSNSESCYLPCSSPQEDMRILHRPYSEPPDIRHSAFKPVQKMEPYNNKQKSELMLYSVPNAQFCWPNFSYDQTMCNQNHLFNNGHCNDEAQIETLVSSLGKSKEGHVCLYCGKCYSRKYGLKIHIRTHTGYKPLKCKFCMRPFGDPSNLNKHVRLHAEGDTPYKCDLCGKILVRRRDLERHLKSRHMGDIHPGRSIVEETNTSEPDITDEDNEELSVDR